jgi:hypothetical protein
MLQLQLMLQLMLQLLLQLQLFLMANDNGILFIDLFY